MIFQDNVLKAYLKNVYFLTGTPCGGKTTISRALGQKHGFFVYDIDERFPEHRALSSPGFQPSMHTVFPDADAFFGRSVEEYTRWLIANTREQLDFVLLDLIRLSQDRIILCDCHLTMEQADILTDPAHVAFLIRDPSDLAEEYCNRPDHQDFRRFIESASSPEKAKAVCSEALKRLNAAPYARIRESQYFWTERTAHSTVADTLRKVEQHFAFAESVN